MPIQIQWDDDEQTRIYNKVTGVLTWEDIDEMTNTFNAMVDTVSHNVYILQDLRECQGLPKGILARGRDILRQKRHPRVKTMVQIGFSPELRVLWSAFLTVTRWFTHQSQFLLANTPEEARQLLDALAANNTPSSASS
jgi:hypothetical protein